MKEYNMFEDQYSLRGRVYNILRENILDGKYKPGENLIELKLANELHVSRTPVREAIRQLELEGLVESIPNKGVIVKGITKKDMEDIYKIRIVLEGLAARWAIEQITDEKLKQMKELYELMEFYTQKNDIDQIADLNTKFHDVIFTSTNSNILQHILRDFQFYVKWARHESLTTPGRKEQALKEHYDILKAFESRDAEAAVKYLTIHVENSSKNVLKKLAEK
ncbi:GntR family transcriptional regulator [Caloramator sp. E03]|uniref:GntR family transcriptional regulator n=1 Tax=Caloramator sp. E03 TaxID=2576307 RepID=UPI001110E486|nr:GntR family transcriptional regulator [Caloramator sp. E03]QCX33003.1 GntR family transcriptional regulator [Caloramator sp. E03]